VATPAPSCLNPLDICSQDIDCCSGRCDLLPELGAVGYFKWLV
jgi:hypothetical protein